MKIDLTGKHAPVTSATGDLGRVMIRTLVECVADVVIYYGKNEEYAGKLVEETSASGKKAIAVQADITDFESVMKMRDYVIKNIGTPDIISVVGDTVGDRLKDTAGSALNLMIKVMNLVSLLAAPVLVQYKAEQLPLPLSC